MRNKEVFGRKGNTKRIIDKDQETFEMLYIHNEEKKLEEFNTHRVHSRQEKHRKQRVTQLSSLNTKTIKGNEGSSIAESNKRQEAVENHDHPYSEQTQ